MKDKQTIKREFQQDGYVLIPGFLSQEEVTEISKNFNRVIDEVVPKMPSNIVFYEGTESPETLKQLIDLHVHDSFFNEVLTQSKFKDIAEFLLDDEVIGKTLEYFNKPAKIGKPTPPHQDGYYFMLDPNVAVTMWMALEPADDENGSVKYVKGSHLKGMRPHGRTTTLGFSQAITDYGTEEDQANLVNMAAKPGDLLIHHSLTVHLAGANKSETRSRKALGLVYFGKSAKEDLVAKAAYQKRLEAERLANA